jgi:putative hydrolase of the HAD superfamily
MSAIEAVVFDMDEVLCRYRLERRLALLASWSGRSPDAIHAAIWRSGFEDEAERGMWAADAYLQEFGARLGYPLSVAQWIAARRAAMEPDETVLSIARRVGADLPIAMFTNNPLLLKRHIGDVFPAVPEIFGERAVFSAELGRSKPDPEAFHRLVRRLEVPPGVVPVLRRRCRVRRRCSAGRAPGLSIRGSRGRAGAAGRAWSGGVTTHRPGDRRLGCAERARGRG